MAIPFVRSAEEEEAENRRPEHLDHLMLDLYYALQHVIRMRTVLYDTRNRKYSFFFLFQNIAFFAPSNTQK